MKNQQALWTALGPGWTPKRGIHRGLQCSICGSKEEQMYEREGIIYCTDDAPTADFSAVDPEPEQLWAEENLQPLQSHGRKSHE